MFRIGSGYDVHRLVGGRPLILGGVTIPHPRGLLGHSDADVLFHAVTDSLLGALALGDIGGHFPDTDPRFKGADSGRLLAEAAGLVLGKGWKVANVDVTVMAQNPKLAPFIPRMRENLAHRLSVAVECCSIKATTTEGLGFVGREEGIASQAVVLLVQGG
ncbi:MAG: 2-C-methyl-D-erythritol 2,4-cyclodiphosphate synthase [Deltaproteobacteria bacterium]|nr:2-C-methyl-D-erythritol 2,4-cyclodiphosphate synthase [Deltaproteobacteria bacterium]